MPLMEDAMDTSAAPVLDNEIQLDSSVVKQEREDTESAQTLITMRKFSS